MSGHGNSNGGLKRLNRIDEVCDEFERRWNKDHNLRAESFVHSRSDMRECPIELVLLEIDLRYDDGELIHRAEYFDRFPDHIQSIKQAFSRFANVDSRQAVTVSQGPQTRKTETPYDPNAEDDFPDRLGTYEIAELIGAGSFGVVYRAVDLQTQQNAFFS